MPLFAAALAVAAGLVVAGVALWTVPGALVVAGVLLAGWSVLFLLDVSPRQAGPEGP